MDFYFLLLLLAVNVQVQRSRRLNMSSQLNKGYTSVTLIPFC